MIFARKGEIIRKDDHKFAPRGRGWGRIPIHRRLMKKTVLIFGVISGVLSSAMMLATVPFIRGGHAGYTLGYTTIVLSFLLVYFGIRSYRDNVGGGQITFGKGFTIGILITLISCVFYVVTWEVVYFNFLHGMMDGYFAHAIDKAKASGA